YNELPDILPDERYWRLLSIYEQANRANRAMAELKGRLSAIPNPDIFINALSLQEAKDSSSIENVFTTNDKLFKAFTLDSTADLQTKEVLRYGKALVDGFGVIKSQKNFSVELIELIYRNIKKEDDGIRDLSVYIGNNHRRVYTPPCCRDVILGKLENWISVANSKSDDIDPLIKMAILHYQFEAIHPFKDGNGRTGRVINVLFLSAFDLLDDPVLYLSKYINEHKNEYYRLLLSVTENNSWEEWILFMLKGIEETSRYTLDKVLTIIELFNYTKEKMQNEAPDIYSFELLEALFTQVYCKYAILVEKEIASRNTASKYLNKLVEIGILEKEKVGNEFIFKNKGLYEILRK
ncbi:MAG: Fic/DOC family N-terminal domain-containing protein, partial [Halobacteriota archaeon]|nr:Fic/DOC family N-terminal domain-containing protein [Halobacteriota archaeon]